MREHSEAGVCSSLVRTVVLLAVVAVALGAVEVAFVQDMIPEPPAEAAGEDAIGGVLLGRVLDPEGQPIKAAEVVVVEEAGVNAPSAVAGRLIVRADDAGSFRVNVPSGTYLVDVAAPGWLGVREQIEITKRTTTRDFVLTKPATLFGRILDMPHELAGANLAVRVELQGGQSNDGHPASQSGRLGPGFGYEINRLSEGIYSVAVLVAGRPYGVVASVLVPGGKRTRLDIPAPMMATVAGQVRPVEMADQGTLMLDLIYEDDQHEVRPVQVSEGGEYVIKGLRSGPVTVVVRTEGAVPTRNARLELEDGATTTFDIILPTGAVSGTVVDPRTNGPIEGAWVGLQTLEDEWQAEGLGRSLAEAVTGPDGQFHIGGLPEGSYLLVVTAQDFAARSRQFDSDGSGDLRLGGIRLSRGVDVMIVVKDASGEPDPNARVLLEDDSGMVEIADVTDDQGQALLTAVPEGEFLITVYHAIREDAEDGGTFGVTEQRVVVTQATKRITVQRKAS